MTSVEDVSSSSTSSSFKKSNVLLLEHVNLEFSHAYIHEIRKLYLDGLGFLEDPRPSARNAQDRLLWANAGLTQIHLPLDVSPNSTIKQHISGVLGIGIEKGTFSKAIKQLTNVGIDINIHTGEIPSSFGLGTCIRLIEVDTSKYQSHERYFLGGSPQCKGQPGFFMNDYKTALIAQKKEKSIPLGLLCIEINVPVINKNENTIELSAIASFWRDILHARVEEFTDRIRVYADSQSSDTLEQQQYLEFIITNDISNENVYTGWHIALYLQDFESTFLRALEKNLIYDNPRFSDRGGTLELARLNNQFRTLIMGKQFQLELEIRSLLHSSCPL